LNPKDSLTQAAERINRVVNQLRRNQINPSAAAEIFRSIISEIRPILEPFDKPGVYWLKGIREFVKVIHESGLNVPFIEQMWRK
jgi:hypothetical protein